MEYVVNGKLQLHLLKSKTVCYLHVLQLDSRQCCGLTPKRSKVPNLGISMHKNVYVIYTLPLLAICVKIDPIHNQLILKVHFSNQINALMLLKICCLKSQPGCPWMQRHTKYVDYQCHS